MIVSSIFRILLREHLYKPITGNVLCLGRQFVNLSYNDILHFSKLEGYDIPKPVIDEIESKSNKDERIDDKFLFRVFGVNVTSMDVTDYERAEIIHNLNFPVPDDLHGKFDFIIDGGTFDHLFDTKTAFENVVKMLTPTGRVIQWNAASGYLGNVYLSFSPDIFFDYYNLNKFVDCQCYIAIVDRPGQLTDWEFYEFNNSLPPEDFPADRFQMVFVIAERDEKSTFDKRSVQQCYRDSKLNREFEDNLAKINNSSRRYLKGSSNRKYTYIGKI